MYSFVVYLYVNGKGSITSVRERALICLLLFTCNYVVSVLRGFLFLCVLRMGYVIYMLAVVDQLPRFGKRELICLLLFTCNYVGFFFFFFFYLKKIPRFGKRELICLLLFTCNYVVSVQRGFLFL